MKLDFFVRNKYIVDTLAPIWNRFPVHLRGNFFLGPGALDRGRKLLSGGSLIPFEGSTPDGDYPILTAAYSDMAKAGLNERRKIIYAQHGIGHTFGLPPYANGGGQNSRVDLWLAPNLLLASKILERRQAEIKIIGSPKDDDFVSFKNGKPGREIFPDNLPEKPIICISCHWGGSHLETPELRSAWEIYFPQMLDVLKRRYKVIGHSHPSAASVRREIFRAAGIEFVEDFRDVVRRADVYINDVSSTLYEFLLTGKPVILLNAPWYRRDVNFGLRFWEYSDVGINVNEPDELIPAIDRTLAEQYICADQRLDAINNLFPYAGEATNKAVNVLVEYLDHVAEEKQRRIDQLRVMPADTGVLYMSFGIRARDLIKKSVESLRAVSGNIPVVIVGDTPVPDLPFIEWQGESPFDPGQMKNFQFRAGRIKPCLYDISPFDKTLYVDADTQFEQDITRGFNYLLNWDFAIAQERHSILGLYNVEKGRWHHDMQEREQTILEFGGNGNFPFVNSGVFFWRKNDRAQNLFAEWARQWMRFQQWDEQAALLRALNKTLVKVLILHEAWNFPHGREMPLRRRADAAPVIRHLYGRGHARTNK